MRTLEPVQRASHLTPSATSTPPRLSVIVPAYQCAVMLQASLNGLMASDLPRDAWELVVVDDGSTDSTPVVAASLADRVITVPGGPKGPAGARNLGAEVARGDVLVFVDADVVVAPTTLREFDTVFQTQPTVSAAFGAYDDTPADPGLVSQYRNLVHRYVHAQSAGDASTWWAGCGAVRRDVFFEIDGFDDVHFPRPQIEDIDLGYRLRAHGERIVLVPTITGTHLKRWTLSSMLRTDLKDRAIPWIHLLLRRTDVDNAGTLNLGRQDQVLTGLAGLSVLFSVLGLVRWDLMWTGLALACIGAIVLANAPLLLWLARRGGLTLAAVAIPLRVVFYVVSAVGAGWAIITHGRLHYHARPPLKAARLTPTDTATIDALAARAKLRPDALAGHKFEERLRSAFAPMDARALGLAIGVVAALCLTTLTILSPIVDPRRTFPLQLLREFFPGYGFHWRGVLAGAGWGFFSGFVGGWMLGTVRNVVIAVWLLKARIRTDLPGSQESLD